MDINEKIKRMIIDNQQALGLNPISDDPVTPDKVPFDQFLKVFSDSQGPLAKESTPAEQSPFESQAKDFFNSIKPPSQPEIPYRRDQDPLLESMGIHDQSNGNPVPERDIADTETPTDESASTSQKLKASLTTRGSRDPQSQPSPAGQPVDLSDKEYTDAQERARQNRMYAGMLAASTQAAQGIASLGAGRNVDLNQSGIKNLVDAENMPLSDLTAKRKSEKEHLDLMDDRAKNDPNSPVSKLMRDTIVRLSPGMKIPDNFTAAQAEKVFPSIAKVLEQKNMEELRKLQYAQLAESKSSRLAAHASEMDIKRIGDVSKRLVAEASSSRSAFGKAAVTLQTIQNAEALLNGEVSLDQLDTRQMSELARVLDRTLSGGNPTISGTEHLTPESASAYVSKFMEKIFNEPRGAGQGKFAEKFQHTFDREKKIAAQQIISAQGKILAPLNDIARRGDGDAAKVQLQNAVEGVGLKGAFNKNGVFIPDIGVTDDAGGQDPQIAEYAKTYKLPYAQAEKIIKNRQIASKR